MPLLSKPHLKPGILMDFFYFKYEKNTKWFFNILTLSVVESEKYVRILYYILFSYYCLLHFDIISYYIFFSALGNFCIATFIYFVSYSFFLLYVLISLFYHCLVKYVCLAVVENIDISSILYRFTHDTNILCEFDLPLLSHCIDRIVRILLDPTGTQQINRKCFK